MEVSSEEVMRETLGTIGANITKKKLLKKLQNEFKGEPLAKFRDKLSRYLGGIPTEILGDF